MCFSRRFAAVMEQNSAHANTRFMEKMLKMDQKMAHRMAYAESKFARKLQKMETNNCWGYKGWRHQHLNRGPQPKVNLAESNQSYSLEVELAGFNKENIGLELVNDKVAILRGEVGAVNSEIKKEAFEQFNTTWAQERLIGDFERTFVFPDRFNLDGVKATMKDGLLKVEFPKHTEDVLKVKAIKIE
ncbi:hypothetical protein K7432_001343 [Basidiobolus ranarum]|uniref:SHSP domain-containing protein n=1 Tax=Basidiobolus ranarum TaxID=34480 RepID=A0ABR2X377_9FUNG